MTEKKCYQWVYNGTGAYQPDCSGKKCMWWDKCNKSTVEIELPYPMLENILGIKKESK